MCSLQTLFLMTEEAGLPGEDRGKGVTPGKGPCENSLVHSGEDSWGPYLATPSGLGSRATLSPWHWDRWMPRSQPPRCAPH